MLSANIYAEIKEIKKYALDNKVPIMVDDGIDFLTTFIIKNQIESVLEIGTAIGYSAIMMALSNPNLKVTTIERDKERYLEALRNIKKMQLENRITLIFNDALEVNIEGNFDLLFIDAAKGQNINFFEKFSRNLNNHGFVLTDNIGFHGLVEKNEDEIKSRNLRGLIRKIKEYKGYLQGLTEYHVEFFDIGDGIAVAEKK